MGGGRVGYWQVTAEVQQGYSQVTARWVLASGGFSFESRWACLLWQAQVRGDLQDVSKLGQRADASSSDLQVGRLELRRARHVAVARELIERCAGGSGLFGLVQALADHMDSRVVFAGGRVGRAVCACLVLPVRSLLGLRVVVVALGCAGRGSARRVGDTETRSGPLACAARLCSQPQSLLVRARILTGGPAARRLPGQRIDGRWRLASGCARLVRAARRGCVVLHVCVVRRICDAACRISHLLLAQAALALHSARANLGNAGGAVVVGVGPGRGRMDGCKARLVSIRRLADRDRLHACAGGQRVPLGGLVREYRGHRRGADDH